MPVNLIGLGLIVLGVVLMLFVGLVGFIAGIILVLGGIVVLFMGYQRRKAAA